MVHDMTELFHKAQVHTTSSLSFPRAPDVVLQLSDKEVFCYSVVLRARSVFFASFFDQDEWTRGPEIFLINSNRNGLVFPFFLARQQPGSPL